MKVLIVGEPKYVKAVYIPRLIRMGIDAEVGILRTGIEVVEAISNQERREKSGYTHVVLLGCLHPWGGPREVATSTLSSLDGLAERSGLPYLVVEGKGIDYAHLHKIPESNAPAYKVAEERAVKIAKFLQKPMA